jgi:hypothetical protein
VYVKPLACAGADLDGLDNRRTNLRPAGPPDQAANHGKRADNTSGYIGVSWDKQHGKWRAQKALEHYGEFAVLNFPR